MKKNEQTHPAYKEYDLEIKNLGEMEEAKETSGVSTHGEVIERFKKAEEKENIDNKEKDEIVKSSENKIKELESQIDNMKETGSHLENEEFFLDNELLKTTYNDFTDYLTELKEKDSIKNERESMFPIAFTKFLIFQEPFLKKIEELIKPYKELPNWIKDYGNPEDTEKILLKIKKFYTECQKKLKEMLLFQETEKVNDDLSAEECYFEFIKVFMKNNELKRFNKNVLKQATDKLFLKEQNQELIKFFEENNIRILTAIKDLGVSVIDTNDHGDIRNKKDFYDMKNFLNNMAQKNMMNSREYPKVIMDDLKKSNF